MSDKLVISDCGGETCVCALHLFTINWCKYLDSWRAEQNVAPVRSCWTQRRIKQICNIQLDNAPVWCLIAGWSLSNGIVMEWPQPVHNGTVAVKYRTQYWWFHGILLSYGRIVAAVVPLSKTKRNQSESTEDFLI